MNSVSLCARVIVISIFALLAACGGGGGSEAGGGGSSGADGVSNFDPGNPNDPSDPKNPSDPILISQEDCSFRYAPQPPRGGTGEDPLVPSQWHLRNEGQSSGRVGEDVRAIAAWAASGKGEGVRLAVVDGGIETLHEDLFPNLAAFRNYRSGAPPDTHPLPCEPDDTHGTAVAGIAAARDGNGLGVAGVAPRVSLAAYNALSTGSEADVADALRREAGVTGIYNNSWGSPDATGALNRSGTNFRDAILDGIALARGGLGSVYVFPAGNGGGLDNSNYDGYVNARGVVAACAVDIEGHAPAYAEPGANILVCGMSNGGTASSPGITTTDVQNTYRSDFSGTSASTPMVSGVAALVLQANSSLTWRDVRLILARSARKNDAGSAGWQPNAAGLSVHPYYGFGTVDAAAATTLARSWTSVGGSSSLRSCPYTRSPGLVLHDGTAVTDTIDVGADCTIHAIEFIEIGFTATHPSSGDLRIELRRSEPASPPAVLAASRTCSGVTSCGSYDNWVFGDVRNLDEPAQGKWTLAVTDMVTGNEGTWTAWSLTIWGR